MLRSRVPFVSLLLLAATLQASAPRLLAQASAEASPAAPVDPFAALAFRNVGPALMGGRVDDVEVVASDPRTYYVATASGGLWKTTNQGVTFAPVFDDQETSSIGDVAVAPADPNVVYVGTGEPNNRQSSSWGHGVYKSLDGGATWTHLGLAGTQAIGRVVIHPRDPDTAYVAALGPLWNASPERGVFKTSDGGRTWTKVKFIDDDTGFVDLVLDPQSPGTLYAAAYQRRRTPFGYNGGGPGSGLWKSLDGGLTWKKLTRGLPTTGDLGRIGLALYARDPRIVYALVEHAEKGGLYRSEDRGETWTRTSTTNPRPSYYSQVRVDPNNDLRLWVLGAPMYFSEDGGKTFKTDRVDKIHGDYHAMWIDPADSRHMLVGSDGGLHASYDSGRTWDFIATLPLAQFYEVHYDLRRPYQVCGGLQDNGSWCGPSRTLYEQGIADDEWLRVGGGDGFYVRIAPDDPELLYSESQDGSLRRFDRRTGEWRAIRPEPDDPNERYRFNWNSPLVISPHDPKTIWYAGNRVFGSTDRGETWSVVSADLTSAVKRDPLPIFGKPAKELLSRNDGVVHWATLTALAESPLRAGVLWAGGDDGSLQVSRDGARTWSDVAARLPAPRGTYVSRIEPSRAGEGSVYVALDGHRSGDFRPYVFRSDDFGRTWRALVSGLPAGATVSVVREHPGSPQVLFAGTERGLYVSWNEGRAWRRLRAGLPTVPVDDVQIHPRENDLIVATHGRGVWILDDLAPLLAAADGQASGEALLFPSRPAVAWRMYEHKGDTGHKVFLGRNPPEGALLTYFLKTKPRDDEKVRLSVADAGGEVVRRLEELPAQAGLNRTNWDLRTDPPVKPSPDGPTFGGPPRGPIVPPGTYTLTLEVGARKVVGQVQVEEDPRLSLTAQERARWYDAARSAARLWTRADAAKKRLATLKKQLGELKEPRKDDPLPQDAQDAVKALGEKLDALYKLVDRDTPLGFAGAPLEDDPLPLLGRARGLYMALTSITAPPTPQHARLLERLGASADELVARVDALFANDVAALNKLLLEAGLGRLDAGRKTN